MILKCQKANWKKEKVECLNRNRRENVGEGKAYYQLAVSDYVSQCKLHKVVLALVFSFLAVRSCASDLTSLGPSFSNVKVTS